MPSQNNFEFSFYIFMRLYKTLLCSFERAYDLISDIESYPSFLPHITFVRIIERISDTQSIACVSFNWLGQIITYQSTVEILPQQIIAHSSSSLGEFQAVWTLFSLAPCATHITFELKGGAWIRLVPRSVSERVMHAFEKRAMQAV